MAVIVIALLPSAIASVVSHRLSLPATTVAIAPLAALVRRISAPAWDLPLMVTTAFLTCALFLGEMTLTLGLDWSSTQVATAERSLSPAGPMIAACMSLRPAARPTPESTRTEMSPTGSSTMSCGSWSLSVT